IRYLTSTVHSHPSTLTHIHLRSLKLIHTQLHSSTSFTHIQTVSHSNSFTFIYITFIYIIHLHSFTLIDTQLLSSTSFTHTHTHSHSFTHSHLFTDSYSFTPFTPIHFQSRAFTHT